MPAPSTRNIIPLLPGLVAPIITSNGGGTTAAISVTENTTAVTTVTATGTGTLVFSKSGTDAAKFTIGSSSGVLAFASAPDFETPTDANADNDYIVIVTVTDDTALTDSQTITVTVTNVAEGGRGVRLLLGVGGLLSGLSGA